MTVYVIVSPCLTLVRLLLIVRSALLPVHVAGLRCAAAGEALPAKIASARKSPARRTGQLEHTA